MQTDLVALSQPLCPPLPVRQLSLLVAPCIISLSTGYRVPRAHAWSIADQVCVAPFQLFFVGLQLPHLHSLSAPGIAQRSNSDQDWTCRGTLPTEPISVSHFSQDDTFCSALASCLLRSASSLLSASLAA
eukprot:2273935-Rhodomonas_salina.3